MKIYLIQNPDKLRKIMVTPSSVIFVYTNFKKEVVSLKVLSTVLQEKLTANCIDKELLAVIVNHYDHLKDMNWNFPENAKKTDFICIEEPLFLNQTVKMKKSAVENSLKNILEHRLEEKSSKAKVEVEKVIESVPAESTSASIKYAHSYFNSKYETEVYCIIEPFSCRIIEIGKSFILVLSSQVLGELRFFINHTTREQLLKCLSLEDLSQVMGKLVEGNKVAKAIEQIIESQNLFAANHEALSLRQASQESLQVVPLLKSAQSFNTEHINGTFLK